jgi:hypothetical protein
MVDATSVIIMAVKIGFKKGGLKGALLAGLASGASVLTILAIIRNYTDIEEEALDQKLEKISDDDEFLRMLSDEFGRRISDILRRFSDGDDSMSSAAPADD